MKILKETCDNEKVSVYSNNLNEKWNWKGKGCSHNFVSVIGMLYFNKPVKNVKQSIYKH